MYLVTCSGQKKMRAKRGQEEGIGLKEGIVGNKSYE